MSRKRLSITRLALVFVLLTVVFPAVAGPSCFDLLAGSVKLRLEATQAGLKIERIEEAYRFDARSPREIVAAGGFLPNPNKLAGGLLEHVKNGSQGTSEFVSLSLIPENVAILSDGFLPEGRRSNEFPNAETRAEYHARFSAESIAGVARELEMLLVKWHEIAPGLDRFADGRSKANYLARLSSERQQEIRRLSDEIDTVGTKHYALQQGPRPPTVLTIYQYRARDFTGIKTESVGVAHEREVVTDKIDLANVDAVREVHLVLTGLMEARPLDDPMYMRWLQMYLKGAHGQVQFIFETWQPLQSAK